MRAHCVGGSGSLSVVSHDIGHTGWWEWDEGLSRDSAGYGITPAGEECRRNMIAASQVDHARACSRRLADHALPLGAVVRQ